MTIQAIIHHSPGWGSWECYTRVPPTYTLIFGTGDTEEEAKRSFMRTLKESADTFAEMGVIVEWAENINVEYKQI